MTSPDHVPHADPENVPYADLEPLPDLIDECRCAEAECAAHGVNLHPEHHQAACRHVGPVEIDERTRHVVDGYSDYGS
jgi:hypothetical protein